MVYYGKLDVINQYGELFMDEMPTILHHGAVTGVTGSCHELQIDSDNAILIDCGLFQGEETSLTGAGANHLEIDFPVDHIRALVITHVHIDHVGRIPYLLAAGFDGPIYCSEPSAILLPLMLEDALKIGFTRNRDLIEKFLELIEQRLVPLPYQKWHNLELSSSRPVAIRLQRAGHILGSAYVECRIGKGKASQQILFSGDLGAPWAPLLPAPKPPWRADVVVLESTYGDRRHEDRRDRRARLQAVIEKAFENGGTVLIPAFSIGRTQELLYELEAIIYQIGRSAFRWTSPAKEGSGFDELEIIVDSPLANRFTDAYRQLRPFWDAEAQRRLRSGRHPLSFEQLTTIDSHEDHMRAVEYLANRTRPAIVIAASGMCAGGRIVNYLKAMIGDPKHDILFVGYQARGTPGHIIQKYGPQHGYVELDGERYDIRAGIHTIGGYSAHADQQDLLNFIRRMRHPPKEVRLVHGDGEAKRELKQHIQKLGLGIKVDVP
jgi:metallo-beta-lactamase family protein